MSSSSRRTKSTLDCRDLLEGSRMPRDAGRCAPPFLVHSHCRVQLATAMENLCLVNEVLPICLREVQKSDFVIGILGERYGTVLGEVRLALERQEHRLTCSQITAKLQLMMVCSFGTRFIRTGFSEQLGSAS